MKEKIASMSVGQNWEIPSAIGNRWVIDPMVNLFHDFQMKAVRHSLMLLWPFMNATCDWRPNVLTILSSVFVRGDQKVLLMRCK